MSAAPPDAGAPGNRRFQPSQRVRISSEIRSLMRGGERKRTADFDIFLGPSPLPHSRIGLIVPKHRHIVVERNRLKRRMREVARTVVLPALAGSEKTLDVLIRARPGAYDLAYDDIRSQLERMTETLCSSPSL